MFNTTIAETVYKYIELNKFDKLNSLLKEKDLTAISLVSIIDLFVNKYDYTIEELKTQGAIVDVQQLLDEAKNYLQKIQTNPELTDALTSLKRGLIQLMQSWRTGKLLNKAAEEFLNTQAIEIMQSSSLNIKVVDSYIHEHMQKQLQGIYQQWLLGKNGLDQDLMSGAEAVVSNYIHTHWKQDTTFDEAIKDQLTANVHALLLDEYQQGNLQSTEALEAAMVKMLLELVAKKALVQFPELAKHIDDLNTISTNGSSELNMIPVYTESFQKVIADCKSGKTGGPIAKAIQRFVIEGIRNIKLPVDELLEFEKAAVNKLLVQFKQNSDKVPVTLDAVIEKTILDYLEMQCSENQEMGNALKTTVINVLLADWKKGTTAELGKAVESIVMQDCKALIQQIDGCISNAVSASKIKSLEKQLSLLLTALSSHGITIQATQNDTCATLTDSAKSVTQGEMLATVGVFGANNSQAESQQIQGEKTSTPTPTFTG